LFYTVHAVDISGRAVQAELDSPNNCIPAMVDRDAGINLTEPAMLMTSRRQNGKRR
jgi:hypothetical protein